MQTGMVERAAPIEVEVPSGTSPACTTVRAFTLSSSFYLIVRQQAPNFLCVDCVAGCMDRHAADAAAAGPGGITGAAAAPGDIAAAGPGTTTGMTFPFPISPIFPLNLPPVVRAWGPSPPPHLGTSPLPDRVPPPAQPFLSPFPPFPPSQSSTRCLCVWWVACGWSVRGARVRAVWTGVVGCL